MFHIDVFLPLFSVVCVHQVDCNPPGNIVVNVNDFRSSAGGYLKLSLKSVAGDGKLESVELRESSGGSWVKLNNNFGATWEASGLDSPPLDIRITSGSGEQISEK